MASIAGMSVTSFLDIFICPGTHVIVILRAGFLALTASGVFSVSVMIACPD